MEHGNKQDWTKPDVSHQNECGAAEAPVPSMAGEGPGEGAGRSPSAAESSVRPAPEAAVERRLGPGPALRGYRHQDGNPELGRGAAASPTAQQVCETEQLKHMNSIVFFTSVVKVKTASLFTFLQLVSIQKSAYLSLCSINFLPTVWKYNTKLLQCFGVFVKSKRFRFILPHTTKLTMT